MTAIFSGGKSLAVLFIGIIYFTVVVDAFCEDEGEYHTGTVKWFNRRMRFGFIHDDSWDMDIFVHHTVVLGQRFHILEEGQKVQFKVLQGTKGLEAYCVTVV